MKPMHETIPSHLLHLLAVLYFVVIFIKTVVRLYEWF